MSFMKTTRCAIDPWFICFDRDQYELFRTIPFSSLASDLTALALAPHRFQCYSKVCAILSLYWPWSTFLRKILFSQITLSVTNH